MGFRALRTHTRRLFAWGPKTIIRLSGNFFIPRVTCLELGVPLKGSIRVPLKGSIRPLKGSIRVPLKRSIRVPLKRSRIGFRVE